MPDLSCAPDVSSMPQDGGCQTAPAFAPVVSALLRTSLQAAAILDGNNSLFLKSHAVRRPADRASFAFKKDGTKSKSPRLAMYHANFRRTCPPAATAGTASVEVELK